jgi:hypothetical protein
MTVFGLVVLGFVAAVIVHAVRTEGRRLDAELQRPYPLESDGIDVTPVDDSRPLHEQFIEAVDFALWEADQWNRKGEDA